MKYKLFISHICCVFIVNPSSLKVASVYVFQAISMKPIKGLNKKRTVFLKAGVHLPYYLVESRGDQSSVQEQTKCRVIVSQNITQTPGIFNSITFIFTGDTIKKVVISYHFLNPDMISIFMVSCGRKIFT